VSPIFRRTALRNVCFASLALFASLLLTSYICQAAWAEGGKSIAAAPTVIFGQQEFGNTAAGVEDSKGNFHSWWNLAVLAGDRVTIDWGAPNYTSGQYPELQVFPLGTNDYTVGGVPFGTYQVQAPNDNGLNQFNFTVASSGDIPFNFTAGPGNCCSGSNGPYDFTAYVLHAVELAIARRRALSIRGILPVAVNRPEGGLVTDPNLRILLQIKGHGRWRSIGQATVANGFAYVPFAVPARLRRQRASLRAIAQGDSYISAASAAVRVRVA
jgi:hypothetical protein